MRRLLLLSILILVLPASVSHAQGVGEWSIEWVTDMDRDVALEVDQDWGGEVTVRFTVSNERATEVRIQLEYRWDGDQEDLEFDGPSEVTVAADSEEVVDLRIHGSGLRQLEPSRSMGFEILATEAGGVLSGSDELDGSIEMPEIHRLGASAPDSETNLRAGATSEFTISVTNEGNAADSIREVRVTLAGCEDTTVSGQERHVGRNIAPTSEGERVELEFTVESSPDHETATCSVRMVLVGEGTPGDIEVDHRIRVEGVVISSDDGSTSDTQIIGSPPVIEDQLPAPFMTALAGIGLAAAAWRPNRSGTSDTDRRS